MISEDPPPESKGQPDDRPEGIMICCRHCGDFLIRRNGRQEYCDKPEYQKARNAKNQREFRHRKRIEKPKNRRKIHLKHNFHVKQYKMYTATFHYVAAYFIKLCVIPPPLSTKASPLCRFAEICM